MNKNNKLSELDLMDLINDYKSELRKLNYKADICEGRIQELESQLKSTKSYGRPLVQAEESININGEQKRKQRKKETKPRKPYPLSMWDKIILESITQNNHATLSKDIYDQSFDKAKELGIFVDEEKAKAKINQCLVKLANRRSDLVKVKYAGRGYAYSFPEWVDPKGHLKKEYNIPVQKEEK